MAPPAIRAMGGVVGAHADAAARALDCRHAPHRPRYRHRLHRPRRRLGPAAGLHGRQLCRRGPAVGRIQRGLVAIRCGGVAFTVGHRAPGGIPAMVRARRHAKPAGQPVVGGALDHRQALPCGTGGARHGGDAGHVHRTGRGANADAARVPRGRQGGWARGCRRRPNGWACLPRWRTPGSTWSATTKGGPGCSNWSCASRHCCSTTGSAERFVQVLADALASPRQRQRSTASPSASHADVVDCA